MTAIDRMSHDNNKQNHRIISPTSMKAHNYCTGEYLLNMDYIPGECVALALQFLKQYVYFIYDIILTAFLV